MSKVRISVVIPVFNEEESLPILIGRLLPVLGGLGSHEVIFVNDGSTDGSGAVIDAIHAAHPDTVHAIHLRTNCGKAAALQVAFDVARGSLVAMMDADLQDQPEELPKLIAHLENRDLDAVTGWKARRMDSIDKTLPSKFFNRMMCRLSGLEIHDFNCGLKVFRRECLAGFRLYGQMHRFILLLIAHHGFRVDEVPVEHAPRLYGVSKYGVRRIFHGFMDLLTIFFITRYLWRPLHFFGLYGGLAIGFSLLSGFFYAFFHFYSILTRSPEWHLANHPLWMLSPILFLLGTIMVFFGLLGELLTYHAIRNGQAEFIARSTIGTTPLPDGVPGQRVPVSHDVL